MKYKEFIIPDTIKSESKKIYLKIEDDGSQYISCSEDNEDFKAWVAEGNTPEAAD
tara:strand:+ start:1147 stop:1311 length:165 start_codon:yes stop_codon:yes gene_type:complete